MYLVSRVHRHVDAMLERPEAERRRPGIVEDHARAARMRDRGDRGNVLHFERQRARRFGEHDRRVRPEFTLDVAAEQWIVVADVDAEAAQMVVAEAARRSVDGIGDEHMVARLRKRQQRERRRRQAGGHQQRCVAAFERRQRVLEVGDRRQSVQTVREPGEFAARRLFECCDVRHQDRRRAEHRRIDRAQKTPRIAAEMRDFGGGPVAPPIRHGFDLAGNASMIERTCDSTLSRISMSIASSGGSSASNWLPSNVAGM